MFAGIFTAVLVVLGLLVGWFGPIAFKSGRPRGMAADLIASVVVTVVVGLLDWYVFSPMFNVGGWFKVVGSLIEPAVCSGIVLWIMRR